MHQHFNFNVNKTNLKPKSKTTDREINNKLTSVCKKTETNINDKAKIEKVMQEFRCQHTAILKTETRDDRTFLPHVNQCVIDLLALEVSTLTIPYVIQTVIKHFTDYELPMLDLPSKSTCANLADAGHYIVQAM